MVATVSEQAFTKLMLVLLLLICACLMLLDTQRQKVLLNMRGELDNLHHRLNAAGWLDEIRPEAEPSANGRVPFSETRPGYLLRLILTAVSNDQLNHLAKESDQ